ncbi:hypothetical protein [Muribacter muris]|uniref:hypothetical protein n=1 Tax=Muribacter muris TaxID=67855 RepID=UPI00064DB37F|nr:hypothetical protein [Muribacter muris]
MKTVFSLSLLFIAGVANAAIHLAPQPLKAVGHISQMDVAENGELIVINQQGELWQLKDGQTQRLAENVSPKIAPQADYGRIALADANGHFLLWTKDKRYTSTIPMAENATMHALAFATIGVVKQQGGYKLARIETEGEHAKITALSRQYILPDARPYQIDFNSENAKQGHIAVLAEPDRETYQHAVLGDDVEAASLVYLERHNFEPLAEPLNIKGLVFEANQLTHISHNGNSQLVAVMSGKGEGARTVLVGLEQGKLTLNAESEPLPSNRWQSPFVFNHTLYAVQMPHLVGKLVEYTQKGKQLRPRFIESGMSNHHYGDHETNLTAATESFVVVPQYGYTQISIIDKQGNLQKLPTQLPAPIIKTQADANQAYLLLENGEIWTVKSD